MSNQEWSGFLFDVYYLSYSSSPHYIYASTPKLTLELCGVPGSLAFFSICVNVGFACFASCCILVFGCNVAFLFGGYNFCLHFK